MRIVYLFEKAAYPGTTGPVARTRHVPLRLPLSLPFFTTHVFFVRAFHRKLLPCRVVFANLRLVPRVSFFGGALTDWGEASD
jgi:hypothetical protein